MSINRRKHNGDSKVDLKQYTAELIDILRREIRSFNIIVELLILEEKGLVECDNNLLIKVLERQEDVFSSIACLEKSRIDIISRIAENIGEDPNTLTISKLAEIIDDPLKKELVETAHVLAQINEDLQKKKTTNARLIKQGALIVESNIRFILKAYGKENLIKNIYSSDADIGQISGGVCVDGKM